MEDITNKLRSENGAETVEIIIGIVVFIIFGLTVFGMLTKTGRRQSEKISQCLKGRAINLYDAPKDHGRASGDYNTVDYCWSWASDPESSYNGNE